MTVSPTEIVSIAAAVAAGIALVLQVLDKMPFVQNNKTLKTWIDDANDIAGELKLIIPMGATVDQVKALADSKAATVVEKWAGSVSQGEVVTQIIGEFARIVQSGHIVPPSVQPVMSEIQTMIARVEQLIAAMPQPTPAPAPTPAPVAGAGLAASYSPQVATSVLSVEGAGGASASNPAYVGSLSPELQHAILGTSSGVLS